MATEQLPHFDRCVLEQSDAANGRAENSTSKRSTTLRPEIRAVHVHVDVRDARYLAERITDARLLILPGSDRRFTLGHRGATLSSRNDARHRDTGRFLTTVLMTDIVDSTHTVARLGDRRWRELLADHYADCRGQIDSGGGELVTTTGDGIVAIFDTPTRAIRTAIAIQAMARESGMAVRAGVHTGECERLADGLAGLAVHITARICALGGANEVMATGTVRDLVMGSMLTFEPRGRHELRGVPGDWTVFRATEPANDPRTRPESGDAAESARRPARPA
jgi:class 3 adenylate cyclase